MKFNIQGLNAQIAEISTKVISELPAVKNTTNDTVDFAVKNTIDSNDLKGVASKAHKQLDKYSVQVIKTAANIKEKYIPIELEDDSPNKEMSDAINKLKKKDKVGIAGEGLSAIGGAAAGVVASGGIASAAGAATLFGSTSLAGTLGGVFVTATPVGWVIGSAAVSGAVGYSIAKMVRSGSEQDQVRKEVVERLSAKLEVMKVEQGKIDSIDNLNQLLPKVIMNGFINESQAEKMLDLISEGRLDVAIAVQRIEGMIY
jgi:antitoxin component of RelBE/YafQ-DinJ toxin-antitoxin module